MPVTPDSSSKLKPQLAHALVWYFTAGHLTVGQMGPDAGLWHASACGGHLLTLQVKARGKVPQPVLVKWSIRIRPIGLSAMAAAYQLSLKE